ncbi:MAG: peptidase U32 family protein [Armatimonadota bacterium]
MNIELLAPAKDLDCGMAAIDCGADAVYIGAARFGAREAAGNSVEDIAALTRYAHRTWSKVYVTLNTLLHDEEIPEALRLIAQLYESGIDGLIIQDPGLLECKLPPLPLIASTQMHNSTPEKIAFLEGVGFQRAILARELEIEEIREICRQTTMELECFIHGSLCVGYSGQCYLSYAMGGRSGNRGQCAQPCRKSYTLLDGRGQAVVRNKHLLSLRDLNLSAHLAELIEAGVCSFKIEGRLKDRAYIANIVGYYRMLLDGVLAGLGLRKSSSGSVSLGFVPDPAKTFNRGYTTHFLHGRGEPNASIDTPKMVGEPIGAVTEISRKDIVVDSSVELHNGDGICFFDHNGELRGTAINGIYGKRFSLLNPDGIEVGMRLYRNHDHEFLTRLQKSHPERQVAVAFTLREAPEGFLLHVVDEDGIAAEFNLPAEKTLAEKPEMALANIHKQLQKTGGTEFACREVIVDFPSAYFLPVSTLNELRRGALDALAITRETNRPRGRGGAKVNDIPYPETILSFTGNVLNGKAAAFYQRHGVTAIAPAAESGLDLRGRKVMTTKYCLKHQLNRCPREHPGNDLPGSLSLIDEEGHRLDLRFDCKNCRMEVYLPKR